MATNFINLEYIVLKIENFVLNKQKYEFEKMF